MSGLEPFAALASTVNAAYLYGMGSRLVNVRLDEARLRKARKLRESGVVLSNLVREAIDERYAGLVTPDQPVDVKALLDRIFRAYPDPPDLAPPDYDIRDRRAASAAVRRKLQRRGR